MQVIVIIVFAILGFIAIRLFKDAHHQKMVQRELDKVAVAIEELHKLQEQNPHLEYEKGSRAHMLVTVIVGTYRHLMKYDKKNAALYQEAAITYEDLSEGKISVQQPAT